MLSLSDFTAEQRRSLREDCLLGAAAPLSDASGLFGPPLYPITPYHHLLLIGFGNPCFCGGIRTVSAVLQYLWICGPHFRPQSALRSRLFTLRWRRAVSGAGFPSPRVLAGIAAHQAAIALDRPALPVVKRHAGEAKTRWDGPHELACLEFVCRRELGYTRHDFWHTPYGHTNQLLSLHFRSTTADAPRFDAARDKARGARLRARVAAQRAASLSSSSDL